MSKFDLDTHKRNGKGQIIHVQPYRLVIDANGRRFERPPGSGNWFTEGGDVIAQPRAAEPVVAEKTQPKKG